MNDMKPLRRTAKLFWTGRSQAVRLPKEFRFEGNEVRIRREDGRVILEQTENPDGWAWLRRLKGFDDDAVAGALDRPGPEAMPDGPNLD